jgi:hypothetical protein
VGWCILRFRRPDDITVLVHSDCDASSKAGGQEIGTDFSANVVNVLASRKLYLVVHA